MKKVLITLMESLAQNAAIGKVVIVLPMKWSINNKPYNTYEAPVSQ
jgi:hypothetical protein